MTPQPVRPDYGGAWTGGIVPALLGGARPAWLPEPVAGAQAVLLLVLDGLGWRTIEEHAPRLPVLRGMSGGPITTAAPSTTAACLTSIATGLPPGEHGLVGYRLRVAGAVLNVLQWRTDGGDRAPHPEDVQPHPPFLGYGPPVISRAEFTKTGFTRAHLRGTRYVGWRTEATLVEHCRQAIADGNPFAYAYADGVDKVAHAHGLHGPLFAAEVASADRLVADLLAVLPQHAALLVTSDHGQVHVGAAGMVGLDPLHNLVAAFSGEGRFRSLHARPGAAGDLLAAATDLLGEQVWVFTRERLVDEGWLGPRVSSSVASRVGDVVLTPHAPIALLDPNQPHEQGMESCHGGLTADEMLVPLLAARGRA